MTRPMAASHAVILYDIRDERRCFTDLNNLPTGVDSTFTGLCEKWVMEKEPTVRKGMGMEMGMGIGMGMGMGMG